MARKARECFRVLRDALCLADGSDRDCYACRSFRRRQHVAPAIENPTWIDDHARGVNFTRNHALGLNFNAASGEDDAIETPRDYDAIPFNLTFDFRIFPEDHGLFGDDVSLDVSIDAERSREGQRTFERYSLINKAGPFFTGSIG